jgi:hypothetical protein
LYEWGIQNNLFTGVIKVTIYIMYLIKGIVMQNNKMKRNINTVEPCVSKTFIILLLWYVFY